MNNNENNTKHIVDVYRSEDWRGLINFSGDFINFGYWKNVETFSKNLINQIDRILSSRNLYKLVADHLPINNSDNVLEIGCGG